MYKQNSEYKSIQKKLVAAVAMVLVACIMVVSSSYAWFTLSTAPEVKGIQTSVGSNGNLEMALRIVKDLEAIGSMSAGGNNFPASNQHWGNLVNLSDSSYGLSNISLAPARLNVIEQKGATSSYTEVVTVNDATGYTAGQTYNGYLITDVGTVTTVTDDGGTPISYSQEITYDYYDVTYTISAAQSYLKTAVYGPDGRVSMLDPNTTMGIYNGTAFEERTFGAENSYGVKAIGVVSGLSDAELALRNAKNTVYGTIVKVSSDASTSLARNASDLASILITYYLTPTTVFTTDEWDQINATLTEMESIAAQLKNALDQAVIAVGVYQNNQKITAVSFNGTEIETTGGTIDWTAEGLVNPHLSLVAAYKDLATLTGTVTSAKGEMPATRGAYAYSEYEDVFGYLMTTNDLKIEVAGKEYTVGEFKKAAMENVTAIVTSGMTVNISGGIYAQIAKFVGNYSGNATISADGSVVGDSFAGQTLSVPTTMTTVVTAPATTGFHLVYANTWLPNLTVQGDDEGGTSLTDLYAYLIDFAFRTNATGSSLMLQTSGMDRINETNGTDATQGAGSYMEFTLGTGTGYTVDQMLELMAAVRIVFVDDSNKIVAVALLDLDKTKVGETGKANEITDATTYDFIDANGTAWKFASATITDGNKVRAAISLYNYSFDETGKFVKGTKIAANDKGATALMELVQNQATALSTLVYLDGDVVDNGDVAINGTSMTGTMNLQFSSSATLVPMDYTFTETPAAKLDAPTDVAIDASGVLTFTAVENATSYEICINGTATGKTVTASGVNLTTALEGYDLTGLGGTEVSITLVAKADGYTASHPSGAVTYTLPAAGG